MLKPSCHWVIVGTLVSAVGCGDRTPPVMSALTFATNPSGRVPLAAVATLTTDEAAQVSIEITAGEHTWVEAPASGYHVEHSVMVLGLQPERAYQVVVVAANFERMVRIADATGIELGASMKELSADARTALSLERPSGR